MIYYHIREENLPPSSIIAPGRWGNIIKSQGRAHPHYAREQLLEEWRINNTHINISRLNCTFVFDDKSEASKFAQPDEYIMCVMPIIPDSPSLRLDMLWLTWMSEPTATEEQKIYRCKSYWEGRSTSDLSTSAIPAWERLFSCPLKVGRDE